MITGQLAASSCIYSSSGGICGEDFRGKIFILILPQKHSRKPFSCEKVREYKTEKEDSGEKIRRDFY